MHDLTLAAQSPEKAIPSPKVLSVLDGRASWYPYYAGYSRDFVRHVLSDCTTPATNQPPTVLDPWNGAGTTTQVAADMGLTAVGIDLNPVMVVVARARALQQRDVPALRTLVDLVRRALDTAPCGSQDELRTWFAADTAAAITRLGAAIRQLRPFDPWSNATPDSAAVATACFLWTGLFRTVRRLLAPLRGTNPTWVKKPLASERIVATAADVEQSFIEELLAMIAALDAETSAEAPGTLTVTTASSTELPLGERSVDMVVTSPPYCTRIDYAVTTSVELALLGNGTPQCVRAVRDRTIGTTTIRADQPQENNEWGMTCLTLLKAIRNHDSRASVSYYLKTHLQYFHDIFTSLKELDRCLKIGADCVIVVQDSFYKDIHNDLPAIFVEMGESLDWEVAERNDFPVLRNIAGINVRAKKYLTERTATESVIRFRKH